jgi:hypothetical protein
MVEYTVQRRRWWHVQWFSDDDTLEDRKWILKLDLLIVPFSILAYWVKYIDQANLSKSALAYRASLCMAASTRAA